ncbi:MAG TPA: PKD domain-containing protein [Candidatus Limnocylindrales bacterium]|nr:PKD domain-containing protein [Candidatus Limnocylindrales bacterium]
MTLLANLAYAATPVAAATQTKTTGVSLAGGTDVGVAYDTTATCDPCVPDDMAQLVTGHGSWAFAFGATVHTVVDRLDWSSTGSVDVAYDDTLLRQGQTLTLHDRLTTTGGTITAKGAISGSYGLFADTTGGSDFQPTDQTKDFSRELTWTFSCTVPLPGESPRTCTSGTQTVDIDSFTLFTVPFIDPTDLDVAFNVGVALVASVSSDGIVSVRKIDVTGGQGSQNADLEWGGSSPSTIDDAVPLSCTQPAGNEVNYRLTGIAADGPAQSLAARTGVGATVVASPAVGPDFTVYDLGEFGHKDSPAADISFGLTGPDAANVILGTLQKNNIPPIANAGGGLFHTYSGDQGSAITFDGGGSSSVCGFPTLRWDFSDGGVAFGRSPQHTFQGSGTYSGLLTATDATGLTSSTTFSIVVANLAPVVSAGPDTTAAWGRPVAFNGSAVDPGSDDQATLTYSWSFGDGSPSATGGPSVTHSYATPGSYTATLTVCDRLNACASDGRTVEIRKRTVTVGALGDTTGTYDTAGARRASLVDEFGSVVSGRTVTFTVDGSAAGSSVTSSSGTAQVAWTPLLDAGTYAAGAAFAGDSLYEANTGSNTVAIARKATAMTYTGTTRGGPNKVVVLSAVLKDATGTALAGREVVFVLGSQTVSATTSESGIASASLKLNQKNGTYQLTATWTASGADAARYVGSAASVSFKLQAK